MKRKFTFIVILLGFFSVACFAQSEKQKQGGKQNMQAMKQQLKDSLQLTDTQADSVGAILAEYQPQIKTIMKDKSLSKDQKKQKLKPVKKQMLTRLKTILNDEQIQKLEEMVKEKRKGGGKKGDQNEAPEDSTSES